jgi:hypothetical protein
MLTFSYQIVDGTRLKCALCQMMFIWAADNRKRCFMQGEFVGQYRQTVGQLSMTGNQFTDLE